MKRHCRDIKKIIWMKWKLLAFTKGVTRRLGRFHSLKKASVSPKSDEPKKCYPNQMNLKKYQGLLMFQAKQKPKKASCDGKKTIRNAGKKLKKFSQPIKVPKSPEFIDSSEKEEEGPPKEDEEKKMPPLLGVKEEVQSFLDFQKDSKNLTIEKKMEKIVFIAGPYKGYELSYVTLCNTKYLKRVFKILNLEKKTKDFIKQVLART